MYIAMLDGKAIFAPYLVRCDTPVEGLVKSDEGYVCFFDHELDRVKRTLEKEGTLYTVEALTVTEPVFNKTNGVKYGSRSEILDHLERDTEPEGMRMQNLQTRLKSTLDELNSLKAKLSDFEARIKA